MYTQCPHCDAIFQLTTAQLKAANGEVRCGQCLAVFNALNHLSDDIPSTAAKSSQKTTHGNDHGDLWADKKLAASSTEKASIEPATDKKIESTTADNESKTTVTADSEKTTDADIFSEIIAEASQHALPTEAIDQFEEFLSDNAPTALPADADVDINTDADSEIDIEFAELTTEFDTASVGDDETSNADVNGAPKLGEVETVTADLDAELHIDTTDEFAEFDGYLQAADEVMGEKTDESTDSAITDTTDADTEFAFDVDRENAAIIIEESDLEPIRSEAYADRPKATSTDSSDIDTITSTDTDKPIGEATLHNPALDDFSELAEAAAEVAASSESTSPTSSSAAATPGVDIESANDETRQASHNIPALILEDLHAAKAEQLRPSNTPWVIGSLLLMLTLVLQVVYYSRNELAKDAGLRPWLIQMCQYANCTLTQPYDIKQIDIIGREVRSHPSARNALIASTTLINNADFVQPFPLLTVVFSDINGKPMAQRRFTPREYLSSSVDLAAGMTPNLPVRIELELVDPGKDAVNYEFQPELDPRNTRPLT